MRWIRGERSADIEDRRGDSGGAGFGSPLASVSRLGVGGFLLLLVLSAVYRLLPVVKTVREQIGTT